MSKEEWIADIVEDEMGDIEIDEEEENGTKEPESKLQGIIKDFFNRIKDNQSDDCLDKFYEEEVSDYSRKDLFLKFVREVTGKLDLDISLEKDSDEEDWQKVFFRIAEDIHQEEEKLEVLKDLINDRYENLVSLDGSLNGDRINHQYEKYKEEQVEEIEENLEKNRKEYKKEIKKVEKAQKTGFDKIAEDLNSRLEIDGTTSGKIKWKLILYSTVSSYCPRIFMNTAKRSSMHTVLVGDISTGKTTIFDIVTKLSPKFVRQNKMSSASFEGIGKAGSEEIKKGILDELEGGNLLLIPDLNSMNLPYYREFLSNEEIDISKAGDKKKINPKTSLFGAANPKSDFFKKDTKMRNQIGEKEGELSRYDVFIPLTINTRKNERIIKSMNLFEERESRNIYEYGEVITTLTTFIKNEIERVEISEEQEEMMKEAFFRLNKELNKKRPVMLLPRDMEIMARLVNTISCVNFAQNYEGDEKDEIVVEAKDEDIQEGIELWEELINIREQVYNKESREIESLKDRIKKMVVTSPGSKVKSKDLYKKVVEEKEMCSHATFYRKVKDLIMEEELVSKGDENNRMLVAVS